MWADKTWCEVLQLADVSCYQIGSVGEVWAVTNFKSKFNFNELSLSRSGVAVECIRVCISECVMCELADWNNTQCPPEHEERAVGAVAIVE